jgi:hypothetical protein
MCSLRSPLGHATYFRSRADALRIKSRFKRQREVISESDIEDM